MSSYLLGVLAAVGVLAFVVEMLRRRYLKEKFAALWLLVSVVLIVIAVFPQVLVSAADLVGVQVPSNLLFMLAALLLLLVSVQLSYELSRVEQRTQRLAEEVALLRHRLDDLEQR